MIKAFLTVFSVGSKMKLSIIFGLNVPIPNVWRTVLDWAQIGDRKSNLHVWIGCFAGNVGKYSKVFQLKLLALNDIIYYIWQMRNLMIYEGEFWSTEKCVDTIIEKCIERVKARSTSKRGTVVDNKP